MIVLPATGLVSEAIGDRSLLHSPLCYERFTYRFSRIDLAKEPDIERHENRDSNRGIHKFISRMKDLTNFGMIHALIAERIEKSRLKRSR